MFESDFESRHRFVVYERCLILFLFNQSTARPSRTLNVVQLLKLERSMNSADAHSVGIVGPQTRRESSRCLPGRSELKTPDHLAGCSLFACGLSDLPLVSAH